MRKYFKGIAEKKDNNYSMQLADFGCSNVDNEDWILSTEYLRADEIPDACCDAKTNAILCAALLNAYYNKIDISQWNEERIMKLGLPNEEREIPSELNPTLPF